MTLLDWLRGLFGRRDPLLGRQPAALLSKPNPRARKLTAAALMGTAAAVTCGALLDRWEGNRLVPYHDIARIWTNCRGNTKNVDPHHVMTKGECAQVNEEQLAAHAAPVIQCVPSLTRHPNALAASVSLAYNIGPSGFCRSTAARRFNLGDIRGGCDALLKYDRAGGRVIPGLVARRRAERQICLKDAA